MRFYNLLDLRLTELHVFTAAAEYQSITKAADFLAITPSQVSKTIKKLEQQWGVQLFIREKNTVRLTPAGRHAFHGLSGTIDNIEKILDETFNVQRVTPFIRVGCPSISNPSELVVPIVKRFSQIHKQATITIECADTLGKLKNHLLGGTVDIIFTADYEVSDNKNVIEWRAFERCPMYLVANEKHRLAQKETVDWNDLKYEEFVLLNPTSSMNTDHIVKICRNKGFTPKVSCYVPNIYSQLMAVNINPKVACLCSVKHIHADNGLVYKELPDADCQMGFAYRRESHKLILDFAECAMQISEV